jgi:hypothetical protein
MTEDRVVTLTQKFLVAEVEYGPFFEGMVKLCREHDVLLLGGTTILARPASHGQSRDACSPSEHPTRVAAA